MRRPGCSPSPISRLPPHPELALQSATWPPCPVPALPGCPPLPPSWGCSWVVLATVVLLAKKPGMAIVAGSPSCWAKYPTQGRQQGWCCQKLPCQQRGLTLLISHATNTMIERLPSPQKRDICVASQNAQWDEQQHGLCVRGEGA